ncbi:LuxR C-terminal-related transcriptional regulator [uncultured Amnibacterium sp.]|uniref:helix-turn-helix transcriptional regulator n=1 Tax=uncultured Amnibacterium sp. TaxID=1631851 RepID=UPI0035CAF6E8
MPSPAPRFVGRSAVLETVVRHAATGRSTIVTGPPGSGRSRLLAEAAARLDEQGLRVERLIATASASTVPYGVFLGLLDRPTILRVGAADPLGRAAVLRGAVLALAIDVLTVDEASLIDPASAALLLELAEAGTAVVVATTSGRPVPDAVHALVRQGTAASARLDPLEPADCARLAEAVLDGPVEGSLGAALADVAEGHPAAVQEVLRAATRTGAVVLVDGLWRLRGELSAPLAARRATGARFLAADEAEQEWLLAVAVAVEIADDVAEALCSDEVADRVARAGWTVHDDGAGSSRLRRPAQAEAVLDAAGARQRRSAARRLLTAVDSLTRPPVDRERIARGAWLLQLGEELPVAEAVELAQLTSLSAPQLSEQLLRHAVAHGGGTAAEVALAEHLKRTSRLDEAELLLGATQRTAGDRTGADEAAGMLAIVSGFGARRGPQALAALDAHLQRFGEGPDLLALRAGLLINDLRLTEGLALAERVRRGPAGFGSVIAGLNEVVARAETGDARGALQVIDALRAPVTRTLDRLPEGPMALEHDAAWVWAAVCLDVRAAAESAERDYERMVAEGVHTLRAPFAHLLGTVRILQGAPGDAVRLLREAEGLPGFWRDAQLPTILAGLALALVHDGDLPGARTVLERVRAESVPRLQAPRVRLAEAELAAAEGRRDDAIDLARETAAAAHQAGAAVTEWDARYAAMRHGDPAAIDELLALDTLPGVARGWQQDQASALRSGDLAEVDAVARRYWSVGLRLYAIETATEAIRRRADRGLPTTASTERLAQWTAEVPALRLQGVAVPANGLTAREREVVDLAARGLPDRAVADRLGISVRTAQTHLSRAYTKLGVHRRAELAALLREGG